MKYITLITSAILLSLSGIAGGFIIVQEQGQTDMFRRPTMPVSHPIPRQQVYLQLKNQAVKVSIQDHCATTENDQTFFNPSKRRLEGHFIFPVPKGTVIDHFSMFINGKETEAELLDAKKARDIYNNIVRSMKDPALLEYADQQMMKVRIFPIEPKSETRVKLSYSELIKKDDNTFNYNYTLGTSKQNANNIGQFTFFADIQSKSKIKNVYCPTIEMDIVQKSSTQSVLSTEKSSFKADTDIKIYYTTDPNPVGMSALTHRSDKNENGFFLLDLSPGFVDKKEVARKDITFILDASGSMNGEKMDQAKKALSFCVNNLNNDDRFQIIRFSTEAESLFDELRAFDADSKNESLEYIKNLKAIGGTNIQEALDMALAQKSSANRPHMIVFLSDGKPTIGELGEDALVNKVKDHPGNTRIFTFGIGNDINTHLLDRITEETNAYRTYISPNEDIEIKVSNFYTKVSSPVMTDLKLSFKGSPRITQKQPSKLPDLFKGSSVTVMGRYNKSGTVTALLEGTVEGKKQQFEIEISLPESSTKHEFIAPLWAARRVGFLLDQIKINGADKELIEETTLLAKKYGIVTPYTSYLIVEDERQLSQREQNQPDRPVRLKVIPSNVAKDVLVKEEAEEMMMDSGESSVYNSSSSQRLKSAKNYAEVKSNMAVNKDSIASNVLNIANANGRAFYNNNGSWIDPMLSSNMHLKERKIQFASEEYFSLLQQYPELNAIVALGNNIQFVFNNERIKIFDPS